MLLVSLCCVLCFVLFVFVQCLVYLMLLVFLCCVFCFVCIRPVSCVPIVATVSGLSIADFFS